MAASARRSVPLTRGGSVLREVVACGGGGAPVTAEPGAERGGSGARPPHKEKEYHKCPVVPGGSAISSITLACCGRGSRISGGDRDGLGRVRAGLSLVLRLSVGCSGRGGAVAVADR